MHHFGHHQAQLEESDGELAANEDTHRLSRIHETMKTLVT